MATYAFSGAVASVIAVGQKHKFRFAGTWVAGDSWITQIVSTLSGNFTLGKGNIAGQTYTFGFSLRNRAYLALGSNFALSANSDVTGWEEQNAGSAVFSYTSQYGQQDSVQAFATMQGRLAVFGKLSIQMWQIDADPAQFALLQVLNNSGTIAPLSVQSIGDSDVIYLDLTGIRSLKAKEFNQNAFVDDLGVPVDSLVKTDLLVVGTTSTGAVSVVETATGQYWLYLNGHIYVLSRFPSSKIQAWSKIKTTYQATLAPLATHYDASGLVSYPLAANSDFYWIKGSGETQLANTNTTLTDSFGFSTTSFDTAVVTGVPLALVTGTLYLAVKWTPIKFTLHGGQVYILSSDREVFRYGFSGNNTYDHSKQYFELPWLDLKEFSDNKQELTLDVVMKGKWLIEYATNPAQSNFRQAVFRGSATSPSSLSDSTLDKGRFSLSGHGTRIKIRGTCYNDSAAVFGSMNLVFNQSNKK